MSSEKNKATINRVAKELWTGGNLSVADEVLSPSYILHDPSVPSLGRGIEPFKQFAAGYHVAIPDLKLTINDMVADGDKVVWRWTVSGTHNGPLMGIPATGKPVEFTGTVLSRFENGKWAEDWTNWDTLGLLQQIGVVPKMA